MDSDISPIPLPAALGPGRIGRDARPGARQRRQFERNLNDDNKDPASGESQHEPQPAPAQGRTPDNRREPTDAGSARRIDILA